MSNVHPSLRPILERLSALPVVDLDALPPREAAHRMRAMSGPSSAPEEALRASLVENHTIQGPHGAIRLRIFYPPGPGPFPACLNFHGGGWVLGSIDADEYRNHAIARLSGCAVIAVSYRLAPEHPFPTALDEAYAALCHVAREAAVLRIRADRLGVSGSSAGGNLAACLALRARDAGGPTLRGQFLWYPVCDDDFDRPSYLRNCEGFGLTRRQMQWFWDQYLPREQRSDPHAAPLKARLEGLPPAYILVAELDPLCDEGEAYALALRRAGNLVKLSRVEGAIHGFVLFSPTASISQMALAETASAMRSYL